MNILSKNVQIETTNETQANETEKPAEQNEGGTEK